MSARTPPSPRLGKGALAGFARWRDAMRWQRAVNRALRPLELTHTQLLLLHALERACLHESEGASHVAIAREAGLDRATTGAVLRTLEDRGLVNSEPASGSRAWAVLPTAEGLRILQAGAQLVEKAAAVLSKEDEAPTRPPRSRRRPSPSASE